MANNVYSWNVAIKAGNNPRNYPFEAANIPLGCYEVMLDFKIWAKKVLGVGCYFTQVKTGNQFQLTVYCKMRTGLYQIEPGGLDFTQCPTGVRYLIEVVDQESGKPILKGAALK